jgi:hypothetical protein
MNQALTDALLGCVTIGKGGVVWPIQAAKTCLQEPIPGCADVLVTEMGQDRHKAVPAIEHQHAFFIVAIANAHRLKREGHAAACVFSK